MDSRENTSKQSVLGNNITPKRTRWLTRAGLLTTGILLFGFGAYCFYDDFYSSVIVHSPIKQVQFPHFSLVYSNYHQTPLLVQERLTKEILQGDAPRARYFFSDEQIHPVFRTTEQKFKTSEAYKRLSLNRGHMAAAGNYSGSQAAKYATFSYSNVIPQHESNNTGIWNTFERYARGLLLKDLCDELIIESGPIYPYDEPIQNLPKGVNLFRRGALVLTKNGVVVPNLLYKVLRCIKGKHQYASAFAFENKQTEDNGKSLQDFEISLSKVSKVKGQQPIMTLKQLDPQGMKKVKQKYDREMYIDLMEGSQTIQELSNNLSRARRQKIYINLKQLQQKLVRLGSVELDKIQQLECPCHQINKLMSLDKHLFYLESSDDLIEQINRRQILLIPHCKSAAATSKTSAQQLSHIKEKLSRADTKTNSPFTYLNQERLQQLVS